MRVSGLVFFFRFIDEASCYTEEKATPPRARLLSPSSIYVKEVECVRTYSLVEGGEEKREKIKN